MASRLCGRLALRTEPSDRLAAMARAESRRCHCFVHRAQPVAGQADAEVEGGGRARLCHARRHRQPRLHVRAAGRRGSACAPSTPTPAKCSGAATYPAAFTISPAAARHEKGPKSTPTFADGQLFTLGMTGIVSAFDAATGKRLWQTALVEPGPLYHTSMSPLIDRGWSSFTSAATARGPDRLRREHRRREVALGRRRTGLWVADRGRFRRHPANHHAHSGQPGWCLRVHWRAAVEAALRRQITHKTASLLCCTARR